MWMLRALKNLKNKERTEICYFCCSTPRYIHIHIDICAMHSDKKKEIKGTTGCQNPLLFRIFKHSQEIWLAFSLTKLTLIYISSTFIQVLMVCCSLYFGYCTNMSQKISIHISITLKNKKGTAGKKNIRNTRPSNTMTFKILE